MVKLKFGLDKIIHFLAGYAIASTVYIYTSNWWISLASAIILGVVKEIHDKFNPKTNTVDIYDFYATCNGGIFFVLVILCGKLF